MKTKETIDRLVNDLSPVRTLPAQSSRFSMWLVAVGFIITLVLSITGFRRTLSDMVQDGHLWMEFLPVTLLGFASGWSALELSVPGRGRRLHRIVPLALFGVWVGATLVRLALEARKVGAAAFIPDAHFICAMIVTTIAVAASIPLFVLVGRAAPLDRPWSGALTALAATGAAMICVEFICLFEAPAHVLAWHVVPVALMVCAAAALTNRFSDNPTE